MATEPEAGDISAAALARWDTLRDAGPLDLRLSRDDFDNLLLGLRNMAISQSHLVAALSAHVDQDMARAVDGMMAASTLSAAAFARINRFIAAVMASATPDERQAG